MRGPYQLVVDEDEHRPRGSVSGKRDLIDIPILGAPFGMLGDPVQSPIFNRGTSDMTLMPLFKGKLTVAQCWSFMSAVGALLAGVFSLGSVFGRLSQDCPRT